MQTQVPVNDMLLRELLELTGLPSEQEVVRVALESLRETKAQVKLKEAFGAVKWEGDLEAMRLDS